MSAAADVFLSYSRADAEAVRQVQSSLKEAGLSTFLDRDDQPAGQPWLSALEQAIARCGAVAVLVGPAGLGTWQQREVQLALARQAEAERAGRLFPVIPVLLPKVEDPPGGFLRLQTWVDLRSDLADPAQIHLLLAGIRGQAPANASSLREAICPYRGLLAFREEDAGLFFGREEAVDTLLGKLHEHSLITLVGRSGSGKSSVVSAGLIPALRRRADGHTWSIRDLRPGPEPLHALVRLFDPPAGNLPPFEADRRIERQVDILRTADGALGRRIRGLLAVPEEKGTERLLLHVDQWEELYTQALRHPGLAPGQAERDVVRFIDLLLDTTRTSPCTVVLTVRADFYGEVLRHGPLAAAVPPGLVNLGPMLREGLAAAITEPARAVGLGVDPPLLEELLDEVCGDLGKLPLLEYALKETWRGREGDRLTLNAYGRAGGIDGAVAQRADAIFSSLSEAEQVAARRLFVSLVTPGEGREDTRARAVYPEQNDAICAVIREFSAAEARLLVTGGDAPTAQRLVEISHEALIREWDLLRGWIDANREALRRREHIRARMRQWEEQGRDGTLLLSPGLPLEEGRKLLSDHGDVLIEEVEPYIAASIAADEERRRREEAKAEAERQRELTARQAEIKRQQDLAEAARKLADEQRKRARVAVALSLVAALLAAGAIWQWSEAQDQTRIANDERTRADNERTQAERNLSVAQRAADGLVFDLAQQLKTVSGVSNETVRSILGRAEKLLAELAGGDQAPPELLRTRAAALDEFANAYMAQGDLSAAQAAAEQSNDIVQKLAASDPGNADWQRGLSLSWNKLGDVRQAQGDLAGALQAYEEDLKITSRLAAQDPGNAGWQRDLSVSWGNLGNVRQAQGDLAGALQAYEDARTIRTKLVAQDPGNAGWQRDLSLSWARLGYVRQAQGNRAGALQAYEDARALLRRLAEAGKLNAEHEKLISWIERQRAALAQR
jgi:tetratricopeptide (TPR) repeat protein